MLKLTTNCEVINWFYLGDYMGACSELLLDVLGEKSILMNGTQMDRVHPLKHEYYTISLIDEMIKDIYVFFKNAYDINDKSVKENVPIYITCQIGISRSESLVLVFIILKHI